MLSHELDDYNCINISFVISKVLIYLDHHQLHMINNTNEICDFQYKQRLELERYFLKSASLVIGNDRYSDT
jgi:hypothetical protein